MKNIFKLKITLLTCILAVCFITTANAQVTGPKSIPGDYADLATAITDLNTNGVGVGGATINIIGGYTETAPAGGFVLGSAALNASLSVSNPLVIQKNGGANPVLTAFTPGTTTNSDGIFKLNGADFVTINGIDLAENAANNTIATGTAWMEWGYALVRLSGTDGCQNDTIKNCTVTLNKANFGVAGTAGSHGIYSASVDVNNAAITVSAVSGANSSNKFYSNSISNCNIGMYIVGFAAASPWSLYDQNNDAGGTGVSTGNQVTNWGSAATTGTLFGIYFNNQNNSNGSYNTVDNALGGAGVQTSGNAFGIVHDASVNTVFTSTNNNVTMTRAAGAGGTTAIASFGSTTGSTTGTITINNNTVRAVTTAALTGAVTLITASNAIGAATTVSVQNNILSNTNISTTGVFQLINATNSCPTMIVSGNVTAGGATPWISNSSVTTNGFRGIISAGTGATTGTHIFSNNNFSNITLNVNTNSCFIIVVQNGLSLNNGPNVTMNGNTVNNVSNTGSAPVFALNTLLGKANDISNNTVSNVTSSLGLVVGIVAGNVNTLSQTVSNNTIRNLSSGIVGGFGLYGINLTGAVTTNVFRNKIYDCNIISPSNSLMYGIYTSGAALTSVTNIYNNFIGRLTGQCGFVNGITAIANSLTSANTTNVMNVYYNTVYLDNVAGVSNCYYSASANGTLVCRNNIFVNNSTGQVYCLHRAGASLAAVLATYGAASNNNIFWPTTAAFVLFNTTLSTVTTYSLSAHQANATPRDNQSKTEVVPFLNTATGSSANYLHVNPAIPTQAESGAVNIATFTDDYDTDIRQGNPGYTGSGTAPDIGADEGNFTLLPPNDATVIQMYTLGKMAVGYTQGYQIQARVQNVGALTIASVNVTLTVSGANSFSNVQAVTSLAPGASQLVTFAGFSPSAVGANTVTISVASDDNNLNNSLALPLETTSDIVSYRYATPVITSGVGFTGATGDFIAKFVSPNNFGNSDTINGFEVFFVSSGLPFQVGVWGDAGGTPGALIYSTASQNTTAGTFFISLPDVPVSGTYYVGLKQTGTTNLNYGYQAENVVRTGAFFYTSPTGGVSWTDFNTGGAHFRISATVQYKTPQPPACAANLQPPNLSTVCEGNQLTWASGGGGPTGYRITLGTNSPNYDNVLNNFDLGLVTSYTLTGLTPNSTYGWKITPYNITGPAVGCGFLTFTTPSTGTLNEDFTNVTFPPQCWSIQTLDWARNAVSANGVGTGSAWFDFYNVNPVTVPQSDLTTPVFTAAPFNYAVTFNHAYAPYDDFASGDYIDTLEILASTNGGSSYTLVAILEGGLTGDLNTAPATDLEFVPTAGQWGTKTIPIPTGTNRIIFRAISNFGNDLFLDNITLVALPNCVQSPIAPVNASSMCPSASTLLSWSAFPGATGYNVYLDASLVSTNQAGTTYTTGALSVGPHTWSVIPQLISGTEPSCSNWSFTVNAPPTPDASNNSPVCEGFPLNLFGDNTAIGQTSGNTWSWSGPSFSSSNQNPTVNATATLANAGTYTLTVTNSNGCTATSSTDVVVNSNPVLSIGTQTNVSCNGLSDGSVDLDVTNGTAPYLFDLIGPSTPDGIFTGLAAGPYTATVNDDNGCAATSLIVTITEPPVLTVSAGSNTPVCSGTSLNLTSSPVGGTVGYSYAWTGPSGPVPAVQNPTIATATTADGGQYDVLVTDAHGCTSTGSHTVVVNASPTAAIALSGSGDKCLGQSATVSLTFTGTGPWNYTITGNGGPYSGSTSSNPASVNVTPIAAGVHNYTVTAIGNASCPTGGTTSGSATVNVSTAPPPSSGPVPAGAAEACAGSVMLITSNVISGQNIIYSWNTGSNSSTVLFSTNIGGPFTAGPFQTNTNQVYAQFGALGGGQSGYQVCLQGVNGCGSSINKCLWIRGVVSGPGAITPANGVVACENTTLPYSCGASSGASVYNWTLGGSATPITLGQGTQNVQVTFPSGFTSGQLCVTAALACGGSSTSAPRCISISSNPANPNVPTGAATACPGATGVSYSIPAVPGATGYNWTVPANATIATGTNSPSITVNFPTPYNGTSSVCVTTTSACGTSAVKCKNVASGIPNQPAGITGPLTNVCGSTVQYSVVSPIASSYTWTTPAGTTISGSATGSTILLNVSPTFTSGVLTVAANSVACAPATSAPRTSSTIWGRPNNPGTITQNPPGAFCSGAALNFSVVNPLVGPTPVYTWTSSNGTITSLQGPNNIDVTWGTNAAGTITVKAGNGCGQSAGVSSQVFTPNNCREEGSGSTSAADFSVYPNPTVGKTTVSFYSEISFNYTLKVIDYLGREVFSNELKAIVGYNSQEVDMSHLAKGMYLIEVAGTDHTQKVKVIVQ